MKQPKDALELSRKEELDVEQDVEQVVEQEADQEAEQEIEKKPKKKIERDVEVILVVKGAGVHQPGDALQQFIRGFWPAVNTVTKIDGVPQTANTMRLLDLEDYEPPAHVDKEQAKLVEIGLDPLPESTFDDATKHIWIKEAYWELGGEPPGKWRALLNEWQMASYALTFELYSWLKAIPLWFIDRLCKRIKAPRSGAGGVRAASARWLREVLGRAYRWISGLDFLFNYMSYWLFYLLLFWGVFASLENSAIVDQVTKFVSFIDCQANVFTEVLCLAGSIRLEHSSLWIAVAMALLLSWAPAYLLAINDPASPTRPPRLPPIIQALMIVAILWNTWLYIALLLFLVAPLVIGNLNRLLWWKHRIDSNTDRRYHRMQKASGAGGASPTEMLHLYPDLVVYRLLVLLFLPMISLALILAQLLIFTRVLGGLGRWLDRLSNNLLGRQLGDVSIYAMDPATAVQVRSAVEYEIKYFHDMKRVRYIHVFAHSQGTPISFETIFNHMPKAHRGRIRTYVTIGSVLGLYYVIAPMLDEVPDPTRFRKSQYEKNTFAPDFQWFNCWNLLDNVTSFCGLDTYDLNLRDRDDRNGGERLPINIRTRTKGHSEYWSNLKEVQVPFARRVIKNKIDKKWELSEVVRTRRHALGEAACWLLMASGLASLVWILRPQLIRSLFPDRNVSLWEGLALLLNWLTGSLREIAFIQPIIDWLVNLVSSINLILNDDGLRSLCIIVFFGVIGLIELVRIVLLMMSSKPSQPQEA